MVVNSIRRANKVLNDDVPTHTLKYCRIPPQLSRCTTLFRRGMCVMCCRLLFFLVILPHMRF
jgi:hypothetical protein